MRVRSFHYAVAIVLAGVALIPLLGQNPLGGLKQAVQKAKQVVTPPAKQQTPAATTQPSAGQQPAAQQPAAQAQAPAAQAASGEQPPMAGSVPMTRMSYALLTMRDLPKEFFDESHLVNFAISQIAGEQNAWKQIGPQEIGGQSRPARPSITFEWQKLIDQQPDFASGALLDLFMKSDPDWSFLDSNPKWDPNAAPNLRPVVEVYLFSKEKVEGRQAEFAARELFPVVKRQLELAIKKLPTHFYFTEQLPIWKYDFEAKGITFQGTEALPKKINLMMPQYDPEAKMGSREYFSQLPAKAQTVASYQFRGGTPGYSVTLDGDFTQKYPGGSFVGFSPMGVWHKAFSESKLPEPSILALDRQVQLTTVPLDIAKAEALTKLGGLLTARIYFAADHVELHHQVAGKEFNAATPTLLYARLEKVEILSKDGALVAAFDPQSFRVASAPVVAAPAAAKPAPAAAPTGETNEQRIAREKKEQNDKMQAEFKEQTRKTNCETRAYNTKGASDPNSAAFKNIVNTCMQEK